MIRQENEQGSVNVSSNVYVEIAGTVATECFGVKGMAARSVRDGLYHLLRKESMSKGVRVIFNEDSTITIDLHIMVDNGVNLCTLSQSIIERVSYEVTQYTGTKVRAVHVFIDNMLIG